MSDQILQKPLRVGALELKNRIIMAPLTRSRGSGTDDRTPNEDSRSPKMKKLFGGVFISNEKFTAESAEAIIKRGDADAIAFGKLFIVNPDLPKRFATNAGFNLERQEGYYAGGAEGYTDYASLT